MTHSFALDFIKLDLHPPVARICVKACSYDDKDCGPFITPDCVTLDELEGQIDRLHQELERIRKQARKKYESV
jgi:hypothetical protein